MIHFTLGYAMKRLLIWLLLIIALIGGAVASLPFIFSSDKIWAQVTPLLEQQLGRKINVSGERKLSLYPNIALVMSQVEIGSNISADVPLASLNNLRISVDLISLISGNINIKELILDGADINLFIDENGHQNWANETGSATQLPEQSSTENDPLGNLIAKSVNEQTATESGGDTGLAFDLATLSVSNFKIINSRLTFEDHTTSSHELAENININISLSEQNKKLTLDGNLTWKKQPIEFILQKIDLENLLKQQDVDVDFKMSSAPLSLDLVGLFHNSDAIGFDGQTNIQSASIKQAANWLNLELSNLNDSQLSLKSALKISGSTIQLGNLDLAIFGSKINGTLNVSTAATTNIYGKLAIDQLDLAQIMPASQAENTASSGIEWSQSPLDLSVLSQVNSNIDLSIGSLTAEGINAKNIKTRLTIRKSTARIPLKLNIFGGEIALDVAMQVKNNAAQVNASVKANNIKIGDALKTLKITDQLTATTSLTTQITTSGASMAQLMSRLNGNGSVDMADGVIQGIAIADALAPQIANIDSSLNSPKNIANFALDAGKTLFDQQAADIMSNGLGQNTGADKQTKFVKAVMNYTLKDGVLSNKDLEIRSDNIIIRGEGQVDIGKQQLNYRIIPKLVKTSETGTSERMTIPAIITGPWSAPNVAVDFAYALQNSSQIAKIRDAAIQKITGVIAEKVTDKIVETVKEKIGEKIGEQVTEQLGDQVGKLLGIAPKQDETQALPETGDAKPEEKSNGLLDAGNLLNGLLNSSN